MGGTLKLSLFAAGPQPLEDVNRNQSSGHDEQDAPHCQSRAVTIAIQVELDKAIAGVLFDVG